MEELIQRTVASAELGELGGLMPCLDSHVEFAAQLLVMRRSCLASCVCDVFQSLLIDRFIRTDLADLRGLCIDFGIVASFPFDFAACFAALSTVSLPSMSLWP